MLDIQIIESVKNDLVNSSCSLNKAFVDGIKMQAETDGSITLVLNNQKLYLTYIPYEDENNEKIHGTKRKNLAKLFVETYTLEELKNAYIERLKEDKQKQQQHIESFESMQLLCSELIPLFNGYGRLEARHNYATCIAELEYRYKSISADKYSNFSDSLIIKLVNNIYHIKQVTFNYCQSGEVKEYQYTLEELKSFIAELTENYKTIELAEQIKIDELQRKQDEETKIINIASRNSNDRENVYILKYNKSTLAISNNLKWAVGRGRQGKYQRTNYLKIAELIQKKNVSDIMIINKNNYNADSYVENEFVNINSLAV